MPKVRTFIDSGVLISAFKGTDDVAERALRILEDANRDFITSDFVRLEVLPKPICYGMEEERAFYEEFFESVRRTVRCSRTLVESAQAEAELAGLSAIDALHVAAAKRAGCHEFVTAEKSTKPLFKVEQLDVISVRDDTS